MMEIVNSIDPRFRPEQGSREELVIEAIGVQVRAISDGQAQVVFFNKEGEVRGARPATAVEQRMWRLLIAKDDNALGSAFWGTPNGPSMNAASLEDI